MASDSRNAPDSTQCGESLAYQGLTVLDLSQGVAAPYCAAMLGLQGASVIKVEPPDGDWIRLLGRGREGLSALAIASNLGKRSISIDASKPEGRKLILRMSAQADVFIESFRPGVIKRLGLDYDAIRLLNSRVIYVSITGFGEAGPWANKAGTDSVLQAYTGMTTVNQDENGKPKRFGLLVPDTVTALYAVQCVGAALYARSRSGLGKHIRLSLAECCAAFQAAPIIDDALFAGTLKPPNNVPAGVFATADSFIVLLALHDDMWAGLCCALGREPWIDEPRYATHALRAEHSAEINLLVAETLLSRSTQTWVETFERFDVLCAEVQNYVQFREHPQTRHMGYFGELQQQPYGTLAVPYLPGTNSVAPLPPAPVTGQHTREILRQFGYTESEIVAMERAGVVIQET